MTNTKVCRGHPSESPPQRPPIKSWFRPWRAILELVRMMTDPGQGE